MSAESRSLPTPGSRSLGLLWARASRWFADLLLAPIYRLYTTRLRREVERSPLPTHVAVILDGNRRWASLVGLEELSAPSGQSMRIRVFGRLEQLPERPRRSIRSVEAATAQNEGLRLNIALGYSGRDELVDASRALVRGLAVEGIPPEAMAERISAAALAAHPHLYTAGEPDPDLIIRTSGEVRLSGFLPWQGAHSELYFTDVYWPAFRELDFLRALRTYQQRHRRFGR